MLLAAFPFVAQDTAADEPATRSALFSGHGSTVDALAITPDGKTLYAGSGREMRRGEVERWDISAYETPTAGK